MLHDDRPTYVDFILEPILKQLPANVRLRGQATGSFGGQAIGAANTGVGTNAVPKEGDQAFSGMSDQVKGNWTLSEHLVVRETSGGKPAEETLVAQLTVEGLGVSSLGALLAVGIALIYIMCRWRGFKPARTRQIACQ